MAVLMAVPHVVFIASVLHLIADRKTNGARSRLKVSAVLASYAPISLFLLWLFPESPHLSVIAFFLLFSVGPILAFLALGFFVAARIGTDRGRNWDVLALCIGGVIGIMTYMWALSAPSG